MNYQEVMAQYHAGLRVPELEQRIAELEAENAEIRRDFDELEKKWDFEVSDRIAMKVDRDRVKEALDEERQLTAKLQTERDRLREKVEIFRESRLTADVINKVFVEKPLRDDLDQLLDAVGALRRARADKRSDITAFVRKHTACLNSLFDLAAKIREERS